MYWLNASVTLGKQLKPFGPGALHAVTIERSWKQLSSTCTLVLARGLKLPRGYRLDELIRVGDTVTVELGYNRQRRVEFQGYVAKAPRTQEGQGIEIFCEDAMFRLRQRTVSVSYADCNLQQLVADIVPAELQQGARVLDARIGPLRLADKSPAQVFAHLSKEYLLRTYFRSGLLHCGFAYPSRQQKVLYDFGRNVASHNLEFKRQEDLKVRVKAVSHLANGNRLTLTLPEGDSSYDTRTFHYNKLNQAELRARAEKDLKELQVSGYSGSLTGWGLPYCDQGDVVELRRPAYPEYDGAYLVDAVKVIYSPSGFRREITLGPQTSAA